MSTFRFVAASVLGASISIATPASSEEQTKTDTVIWKEVGAWTVAVDKTFENHCFIATSYEDGSILRMGFTPKSNSSAVYVAIGNVNWKSIEAQKEYDLSLQLDNGAPWNGTGVGGRLGTLPIISIPVGEVSFIQEFVRKLRFKVSYQGSPISTLSLSGSAAAVEEWGLCEKSVQDYLATQSKPQDPFGGSSEPKTASDPFKL